MDGDGSVAEYEQRDLEPTYTVTTCSGARHYVYRKPEAVHVATGCEWPEVDVVRSDDGFVVAPGVVTPWGEWISHDDPAADVIDTPAELWAALELRRMGPTAASPRSAATGSRWS